MVIKGDLSIVICGEAGQGIQTVENLPLGIFYKNQNKTIFKNTLGIYENDKTPLYKRSVNTENLEQLIRSYKK